MFIFYRIFIRSVVLTNREIEANTRRNRNEKQKSDISIGITFLLAITSFNLTKVKINFFLQQKENK